MKELRKEFIGVGEVRGFHFKQIHENGYAYVYEVINNEANKTYYEVFERQENKAFDCVSYPKSKSFGVWAWCINNYEDALNKYNEVTKRAKERIEKNNNV
jgi:hypothetical protein